MIIDDVRLAQFSPDHWYGNMSNQAQVPSVHVTDNTITSFVTLSVDFVILQEGACLSI